MTTPNRQPSIINAPWPVAAFAVFLLAAHLIRILLPTGLQEMIFIDGALFPGRFWAPEATGASTGLPAYGNAAEAFAPMLSSGFLHADWVHVSFNAVFLILLAKPLLDMFRRIWPRREPAASGLLLAMFLVSVVSGSLVYLGANYPDGPPVMGSSGGISGLLAAILLMREGPQRWLFSRRFLITSSLFVIINALVSVLGPSLLGAGIAWQSHVGGYIGGALFMRVVIWRAQRTRA